MTRRTWPAISAGRASTSSRTWARSASPARTPWPPATGPGRTVADAVFFAVGWPANLSQLNLDAAGVRAGPGAIPVDDYLRTNVGHIFAAGDVNGHSMLVQSARMEGRIAARNAVLGPA